ncbi:MAG: HlyD family efflux transporter periplasmic adaptor subunit [Microcystaceae cyanobacterium]
MPYTLNQTVHHQLSNSQQLSEEFPTVDPSLTFNNSTNKHENWTHGTQEILDTLPKVWTRGLLYFLFIFIGITIPWAMFSKIDETGVAKGRLVPQGKTLTLDTPVSGTVAKMTVKEGDLVQKGQPLVELESDLVMSEIQQEKDKIEGQKNRLHQLELLKNQLLISLRTQQQQNQARQLEKQVQVEQYRQQLQSLKNAEQLRKVEKLAQVNQAKQSLEDSQKATQLAKISWQHSQQEVQRYQQAVDQGIVAAVQVSNREEQAREKQRLFEQAQSDIAQNKLRFQQQKSSYQRMLKEASAEIKQVKLQIKEREKSYQSLVHSGQLAILKSEEQLNNIQTEITTLKAEISQSKSRIKALQFQLNQRVVKSPIEGLIFQLPLKGEGEVLQTGEMIAEIAPKGTSLILKAQMATTESGSLSKGMSVKLKFDAYPFKDYGIIEGELVQISPTTKITETSEGEVASYELEIHLNKTCIPTSNECLPLRPGDTATAEVIVRERRMIDLILDPFKQLQKGGLEL